MSDPGFAEFNDRIARIETARSHGFGFEAKGTLGRSFYTGGKGARRRFRLLPLLRPLLAAMGFGILLKALFLIQIGEDAYTARVDQMMLGDGFDRIGAVLMQADPATRAVSDQLALLLRRME